jgi:hypothetical protein
MKILRTFVITALVLQLAWFLLPQIEYKWLSEDAIVIISYAGFGSFLGIETWMSWVSLAITLAVLSGMFIFGPKWRILFLVYFTLSILVIVPFAGLNVETGLSMAIRDLLNITIGAIIVLAFICGQSEKDSRSIKTDSESS